MKVALCALMIFVAPFAVGCGSGPEAEEGPGSTVTATGSTATSSTSAAPARKYEAKAFLGGRAEVELENGWAVTEDSPGHLGAARTGDPDHRVLFSLDPYPIVGGKRATGAFSTADGLFAALRSNPNLEVEARDQKTVGEALRAEVADVSASSEAVNDDPGCPEKVCVNFVAFPPAGEGYGPAGDDVIRVYLTDMTGGRAGHLLMVSVEGRDDADLEAFLPAAERLIASARFTP